MIEKIAAECRMPLCYGGGIVSAEQAKRIINIGYEKVSLSSAAIRSMRLVSEVAAAIGGQSAVVTLDVTKDSRSGRYDVYVENGKKKLPNDLFELATRSWRLVPARSSSIASTGKVKCRVTISPLPRH